MIQNTIAFSTKFNVAVISPSVPKFILTDLSPYTSEGISLSNVKGCFKIQGPTGVIYNNTNFGAPDITGNISLVFGSVSIPLDTNGNIITGTYTITYTIQVAGGVQAGTYQKTTNSYYCYVGPIGKVLVTNNVRLATVTSTDQTTYAIAGINPTLIRTHTLYYPSSLVLSPLTGSTAQLMLQYPNVYTGTYTGKISTIASYVFTDGAIVDYLVTAVDESVVDNSTICDIYCGIKNLTNQMLDAKATGDFGKMTTIKETLNFISILFDLHDEAILCGKEDDVTNWLNQIISLANISPGCGCSDLPTQVIPDGGIINTTIAVVAGDSAFGTAVTSATVGSTTTYTVRLTDAYKALILGALQFQDLSVTAFRAAGIPEEGRGADVLPLTAGGGSFLMAAGISKKVLVITGNPVLTSSWSIVLGGTPIDGDSFLVDYRATATPNGNTVTIFGLGLNPSEIASGNSLVYAWYASETSTWYAKLIDNNTGGASQQGLNYWVTGSDFPLNSTVIYGSNPSFIYKNIQSAGSGTNPPTGIATSNTWWQVVGNKSALYDLSNNIVFDVSTGKPFIIPTLNTSSSVFSFLVLEGQEIKKRTASFIPLAGLQLTQNTIVVGNGSNVAVEQTLDSNLLRSLSISGITGNGFAGFTIATSGTLTISQRAFSNPISLNGTVTLVGNYNVVGTAVSGDLVPGDFFLMDYRANVTLAGNVLTIFGQVLTADEALAGNLLVFAYWDSLASIWRGRKITYGITIPIGTLNATVRYNGALQLVSDPNVTNDGLGNLIASNSMQVGTGGSVTGLRNIVDGNGQVISGNDNIVGGFNNIVSGNKNMVVGQINNVTSDYNIVGGNGNQVGGIDSIVTGSGNQVTDSNAIVVGSTNTATGIKKIIGDGNSGSGSGQVYVEGINHNIGTGLSYMWIIGLFGKAINSLTRIVSNGSIAGGFHQKEEGVLFGQTTNATPLVIKLDGTSVLWQIAPNSLHLFTLNVCAIQSAGSSGTVGDSNCQIITGAIKNIGGTLSLVGTQSIDHTFNDAAAVAWIAVFTANSGTGTLDLTVTGAANKTIQWTASLTTVKAGY